MGNTDIGLYVLGVIALVVVAHFVQGSRKYHQLETDDERLAAIAFVKTMNFFGVNFILAFFGFLLWFTPGTESLLADLGLGTESSWIAWVVAVTIIEVPILVVALASQGLIPLDQLPAVSERNLAVAFSVLAFIPWIFSFDATTFRLIKFSADFSWWHLYIDGLLLVLIAVFFILKSVLSRRLQYRVLWVATVPLVNLVLGMAWSRA